MKINKILLLSLVFMAVASLFALAAACSSGDKTQPPAEEPKEHEHTYMRVWTSDEEGHWHKATCEHKELKGDFAPHVDEDYDDECDVCGYEMEHVHRFSEKWSFNDEQHWKVPVCGDTVELLDKGDHEWDDGTVTPATCEEDGETLYTCTVCGKTASVPIAATGHTLGSWVAEKASNCTEHGTVGHFPCTVCGKPFYSADEEIPDEDYYLPLVDDAHKWDSGEVTTPPDCKNLGTRTYHCQYNREHTKEEDVPTTKAHIWGADGKCEVCEKMKFYSSNENGTLIYMGKYPQSKVEDDPTIANLNGKVTATPTAENANGWKNYEFYKSGGAKQTDGDYWYIDVQLGEDMYRGVYFTSYITVKTWDNAAWVKSNGGRLPQYAKAYEQYVTEIQYQEANGYSANQAHWFKYEPIEWRVLHRRDNSSSKDGSAVIMANIILDVQPYSVESNNNYASSNVRQFLNNTFYQTAFNEYEKTAIFENDVDNSASTTDNPKNEFTCETTRDKMFLLSWSEIVEKYTFGFADIWRRENMLHVIDDNEKSVGETLAQFRKRQQNALKEIEYMQSLFGEEWRDHVLSFNSTDYAKALGAEVFENMTDNETNRRLYFGRCAFWTRSPAYRLEYKTNKGYALYGTVTGESHMQSVSERYGVLPAMWIEF